MTTSRVLDLSKKFPQRPLYCRQCFEARVMLRLLDPTNEHPETPNIYWCSVCETYAIGLSFETIVVALRRFEDGNYKKYHRWGEADSSEFALPRLETI